MKRFCLYILLFLTVADVCAVPAKPCVVKVMMVDGTTVDATIVGDEYWHCVTDQTGNLLTENGDGFYKVSNVNISAIDVKAQMMAARRSRPAVRKPMNASTFTRGIVILVSFSDKSFTKTNWAFHNMLNGTSGARNNESGSAKQYFDNSSFGAFVPQFDVFGPYTLSKSCSYYGGNSSYGGDSRPDQMIVDAVAEYIKEKGENALQQYDCDNDGYVDNIFVFYAGHGENAGGGSNCIWPHRSYIYSGWVSGRTTYGGVQLGNYACTCELQGASGTTMSGIGPFCHEFSHVIGLPDMYDTQYSGHRTCSYWDVMDAGNYLNGEHTPPSYSAYERFYLGWLTPEILNEPDNVRLEGLNNTNSAKIITTTGRHNLDGGEPDPDEFFILETKDGKGWDKHLPGAGLLITKVKYDYYKWMYNEVNDDGDDMGVDIIEAGGVSSYYASDSDPFPGSDDVTSYTPYSGQEITEITFNRDYVTFRFKGGRDVFKVTFDGMEHGTPVAEVIMESAKGAGVVMPGVTDVDEGYTFEGWSLSASASMADAGNAGDQYYPDEDQRFFAVYSHNGVIEPTDTGCVTETFDKCSGRYSIGKNMDKYCDLAGWYGGSVESTTGAVKVGENDTRGVLVTPRLRLSGDMSVSIVGKALMNTTIIVTAENGNSDTAAIGKEYDTVTLNVGAVPMDTRLRIMSEANIFYLDNVEICGARKTPVEDVETGQYQLLRTMDGIVVAGLKGGERVRVVDMVGRVVDEVSAEGGEVSFRTGKGLFIVQIMDGKKIAILK